MNALFLDVTGEDGLLACAAGGTVLSAVHVDRKVRDAALMDAARACVAEAGWAWNGIGGVACVVGPGGFMSIRVAVAFANALSWANGIPVAGFHGSDVACLRAGADDLVWVHSTKASEVFARGFGRHADAWKDPVHLRLEDLLEGMPEGSPFAGDVLPAHAEALIAADHERLVMKPLADVLPALLETADWKNGQLVPWYGREG